MELTASFTELLHQFADVFTTPTFLTFVEVVTGWLLSHRRRFVTELIFTSGNVGIGHWCRFDRRQLRFPSNDNYISPFGRRFLRFDFGSVRSSSGLVDGSSLPGTSPSLPSPI